MNLADAGPNSAAPLELTAAVTGARLAVTVTNVSNGPVAVWFETEGPDGPLYDCLSVEIGGPGGVRTLVLTGNRNSSTTAREVLAPGAARTAQLDLSAWSRMPLNGGVALAPGRYRATARYRCAEPDCWVGELVAPPVSVQVSA